MKPRDEALDKAISKAEALGGEVLGSGPDILIQYKNEGMKLLLITELQKDNWLLQDDEDDTQANLLTFTRSKKAPPPSRFKNHRIIRAPLTDRLFSTAFFIACLIAICRKEPLLVGLFAYPKSLFLLILAAIWPIRVFFWNLTLESDHITEHWLWKTKILPLEDIKRVHTEKGYGRLTERIVFSLNSEGTYKTKSFSFLFTRQVRDEINRRYNLRSSAGE